MSTRLEVVMPDPADTRHESAERRFDALYRDHHQEILAYCIRRLPAPDAEDAAGEVVPDS